MGALQIGLIGDFDQAVTAHRAIPLALQLAAGALSQPLEFDWLATDSMPDAKGLARFDALWCVPGSPYRSMEGALRAIRFAREQRVPFLGTCGGFQHAVIEHARNVLGWADADHAETAPQSGRAVISALACSLVEVSGEVRLKPGSHIGAAYASEHATEGYHCHYGLNPVFTARLTRSPLRATAHDAQGDVRAIELDEHPFFVCTLFQPERAALRGALAPLVVAFVRAARGFRMTLPEPGAARGVSCEAVTMSEKTFEEFEAEARAAGFDEALERRWAPGTVLETHTHPFDADAVVTQGEMWLTCAEGTRHLVPGNTFALAREVPHAERYGPQGATYWVARRSPR